MKRLTLKARLLLVLALALAPAVTLGAVRAREKLTEVSTLHQVAASSAIEMAQSRQREVVEATRQLLFTLSEDEELTPWASGRPAPADYADRCNSQLGRVLGHFRAEYSALVIIDDQGKGRCASEPVARSLNFADQEFFRQVSGTAEFFVGTLAPSQVSALDIQPATVAIRRDGQFRGAIAIGVSLNWFANLSELSTQPLPVSLSLVDASGQTMAASIESAATLPGRVRIAEAVAAQQTAFRDYARNGELFDYRIAPLRYGFMQVIAAVPVAAQGGAMLGLWVDVGMILLSALVGLGALWVAAERWCLRPLKPIQAAAAAVARGDLMPPRPTGSTTPEMQSLTDDVFAMANAIRVREGQLQASLGQREHMLREIHHRVKNNLQMVSSLLSLQAEKIRSPRILRLFGDAQNRLLTLSILHRHLYERSNWSSVDFQAYINDLVRHLSSNRIGNDLPDVRFTIDAPVWAVGPDTAIPVGLIVTESVSNAFTHAFAGIEKPEIRISAQEIDSDMEICIEDNGKGLAADFNVDDDDHGLGVMLIRGLSMQLGGTLEIVSLPGGGTAVRVRFPKPAAPSDDFPMLKPEKLDEHKP